MAVGNGPDQSFAPRATAPKSQRDQADLACESSAAVPAPRPPVLAPSRAGFFLTVTLCRSKNRQTAVRLPGIRCLRITTTISSKVRSGCSATRANSHSTCPSNGDVLPPLSFALAFPVSYQRCNHLTAELALRLKLSAVSRRDAPATTASITRSRKSSE